MRKEKNMDYIVNPSLFYWAEVFDVMKVIFGFTIIVMSIVTGLSFYSYFENYWWNDDNKDAVASRKRIKKFIIIIIIITLLIIFLPSGNTLIRMYIARLATGSNVELVIQKIIDVAQEIVKAFK